MQEILVSCCEQNHAHDTAGAECRHLEVACALCHRMDCATQTIHRDHQNAVAAFCLLIIYTHSPQQMHGEADACSVQKCKISISASARAENVAQRFYPKSSYMSQHIALAKSGADGHNPDLCCTKKWLMPRITAAPKCHVTCTLVTIRPALGPC